MVVFLDLISRKFFKNNLIKGGFKLRYSSFFAEFLTFNWVMKQASRNKKKEN